MNQGRNGTSPPLSREFQGAFLKEAYGIEWSKLFDGGGFDSLVRGMDDRIITIRNESRGRNNGYYGGYVGYGTETSLQEYRPKNGEWHAISATVSQSATEETTRSTVAIGNKVYVLAKNQYYDMDTMQWMATGTNPNILHDTGVGTADGKLYLLGGTSPDKKNTLSSVQMYDPQSNKWTKMPDLPQPQKAFAAVEGIGKNLFALGGLNSKNRCLGHSWVFNTETRVWKELPQLFEWSSGSSARAGNSIILIGQPTATTKDGNAVYTTPIDVYDTESNTVFALPSIYHERNSQSNSTATVCGNILYFSPGNGSLFTLRLPDTVGGTLLHSLQLNSFELPTIPADFSDDGFARKLKQWLKKHQQTKNSVMKGNMAWLRGLEKNYKKSINVVQKAQHHFNSLIQMYEKNWSSSKELVETEMKTIDDKAEEQLKRARDLLDSMTATAPAANVARIPAATPPAVATATNDDSEKGPPDDLICPITSDLMKDPVVASDGHTYERKAIEDLIQTAKANGKSTKSPVTNQVLRSTDVHPNKMAKRLCQEWVKSHKKPAPPSRDEDNDIETGGNISTRAKRARRSRGSNK